MRSQRGFFRQIVVDAHVCGGSGLGDYGSVEAAPVAYQAHRWSLMLTLPPLAAVFFKPDRD
jgi:1,4-alpha-glucan branching enzyme